MRRKYKLIIIILISAVLTYLIYFNNVRNKINIVALGDGISSGETSYNIDGISYNDYVNEYFNKKKLLKKYNNTFSFKNYKLEDLINDLKNNKLDKKVDLNIQQIIHQANLITIGIGEEELVKLAITEDLKEEKIKEFIIKYDNLIRLLKSITDAKIVLIGYYENIYLDKSNVIILNSELENIAIKYKIIFINISDLILNKEYFLRESDYYFNYKGHIEIANMIINSL